LGGKNDESISRPEPEANVPSPQIVWPLLTHGALGNHSYRANYVLQNTPSHTYSNFLNKQGTNSQYPSGLDLPALPIDGMKIAHLSYLGIPRNLVNRISALGKSEGPLYSIIVSRNKISSINFQGSITRQGRGERWRFAIMITNSEVTPAQKIGETAGLLWQFLDSKGPMNINSLIKNIKVPRDLLMQAIGWLAREDKVEITQSKRKKHIALK
jgi:hypothetical protein